MRPRRALTWHYQWLIVHEFLPVLVGSELVDELSAEGARFYRPDGKPFIPLEFADAAYRYGHSQIRQLYQLQPDGPLYPVFPDLIGFCPVGDHQVDWSLLFDVPSRPRAQRAKPIDGQLPRSLIQLPDAITGQVDDDAYRSLATRDLERGQATGLPSGEAVARLIGADALSEDELDLRRSRLERRDATLAVRSPRVVRTPRRRPARRGRRAHRRRGPPRSHRRRPRVVSRGPARLVTHSARSRRDVSARGPARSLTSR